MMRHSYCYVSQQVVKILSDCTNANFLCSLYIHKSVFTEMDNSSCDMLDHANASFSSSPLHQLLTLLKLKPSNKVSH
jgi:hypothetical protein